MRLSPRPNRANLVQWREWGAAAFEEEKRRGAQLSVNEALQLAADALAPLV